MGAVEGYDASTVRIRHTGLRDPEPRHLGGSECLDVF
jgi:hypothetical protein